MSTPRSLAVAALVATPILPATLTATVASAPAAVASEAPAHHLSDHQKTVAHRIHLIAEANRKAREARKHAIARANREARRAAGGARARVVKAARSYIGVPYVHGGMSRAGVDCSALVDLSYRAIGKRLPRTTRGLASVGRNVTGRARIGDVLLYGTTHAAIVAAVSRGRVTLTVVARHTGTRVTTQRPYAAYTVRSVLT